MNLSLKKFKDGLISFTQTLINNRSTTANNGFWSQRLSDEEKRQIYRTGIGNKIVRLKSGYALNDTLSFESKEDEKFYRKHLQKHVKAAARWMVGFGRGIVVIHAPGDDLSKPLQGVPDPARMRISVFGDDMLSVANVDMDVQSAGYYKPRTYIVRGVPIHHSRVVPFVYVEPPEMDAPHFKYGGISEFDLIHEQLVADGIVQRASPRVLEKASTLFYKIVGFKDAMQSGNEQDMVDYFGRLEDLRGVYAAGLIDAEDAVEVVTQTLTNLPDADQITLRRLAMVTGIPLAVLVGENVRGLNSTGQDERQIFQDTIETLQSDHLLEPINLLMRKCGQGEVEFKDNQGESAMDRLDYETKAIDNAVKLFNMGEDYGTYLADRDILQKDEFAQVFGDAGIDNDEPGAE